METWDLWYPGAAATGLPFARGRLAPTEVLWVHSAPKKLDVTVRRFDGSVRARGQVTRDGDYLPMTRLAMADAGLSREDRWPTDDDLGALVILPGGEVGTLVEWWNAADGSEWRWRLEFYNRRCRRTCRPPGGPLLALRASNVTVTHDAGSNVALRATLYDADGRDREVDVRPGMAEELGERQLLWIDLDGRDEDAIARLIEVFALPDETAKVLASDRAIAQLLRYPDRVHLRLVAMQPHDSGETPDTRVAPFGPTSIDIIVAKNVVITGHHGQVAAFDHFLEHIRGDSALGALKAADFLTVLVDSVLAVYMELVERIERRIDTLDEVALRAGQVDTFLREVVMLRRRVAILRRGLAPHRWAFAPLARPDFELEGLGKPWPGIMDRLEKALDSVQNARELLVGAFDVYMATSAQRSNDVMKALTILSAILLPAVVLAGVMGMNFKIGFFENPGNFWLAVGAMVTLAVAVLGISRWRGWI